MQSRRILRREKPIEPEQEFLQRIAQECRRAERSKQRFVLVLIKGFEALQAETPAITAPIRAVTRETDAWGWYEGISTLGILFAELGGTEAESAQDTIVKKIRFALQQAEKIAVSACILPCDLNRQVAFDNSPKRIYELLEPLASPDMKLQLVIKRAIDLVGSVLLLVALSPLMAIIALAVKLGSPGPVLFRQTRVGQRGEAIYLSQVPFDDGSKRSQSSQELRQAIHPGNSRKEYRMKKARESLNSPRIHGLLLWERFLRRTSMDELPQFWNVLRGEMSLVGPRPPIPYEVECYDLWHQRRVLELKPGITGLWQVSGRSRSGFDEMVRLDLLYARTWSPVARLENSAANSIRRVWGGGAH